MSSSTNANYETNMHAQQPIDKPENENRVLGFVMEEVIHRIENKNNSMPIVCEILNQYPRYKLAQLRRCTLKSFIIFYAQTVLFMDNQQRLSHVLLMLQKVFGNINKDNREWFLLEMIMKKMIILIDLETYGEEYAKQSIDKYFTSTSKVKEYILHRERLFMICDGKVPHCVIMDWNRFKDCAQLQLNTMLKHCPEPILHQIAKVTDENGADRNTVFRTNINDDDNQIQISNKRQKTK